MLHILGGLGLLLAYLLAALAVLLAVRKVLRVPAEVARKMLHLAVTFSVFFLIEYYETWLHAALAMLLFAAVLYPALTWLERYPAFCTFLNQRECGEVKRSLLVFFGMLVVLIAVFWGALGAEKRYIAVVAVMAWGPGDAAAALIGKRWGKRHIHHPRLDGKKTLEGTLSMLCGSFLGVFCTMLLYTALPWYLCAVTALIIAPACAAVELFSRKGMDTITVPLAAAVCVYALVSLFALTGCPA